MAKASKVSRQVRELAGYYLQELPANSEPLTSYGASNIDIINILQDIYDTFGCQIELFSGDIVTIDYLTNKILQYENNNNIDS